jgi:spermidine synthase
MIKRSLSHTGIFVTQAGEIYFSNTVFSCINTTLNEVFPYTKPFHAYIPSFGDWGFVLASNLSLDLKPKESFPGELKYINAEQFKSAFHLPQDISVLQTTVNTLDNPIILNYYLEDWEKWKQDLAPTGVN